MLRQGGRRGQLIKSMSRVASAWLLLTAILSASAALAETPDACIAAARPGWSEQESWVWGRICAGQTADLMTPYAG